jgi:hypothetical protein
MLSGLVRLIRASLRRFASGREAQKADRAVPRSVVKSAVESSDARLSFALRTKKNSVREIRGPNGDVRLEVRAAAVEPSFEATSGRWELSTFCVEGLDQAQVWQLLQSRTGAGLQKPIFGRGDFTSARVRGAGLLVEADWEPERHCTIAGWPDSPELRLQLQQDLSALMVVVQNPERG